MDLRSLTQYPTPRNYLQCPPLYVPYPVEPSCHSGANEVDYFANFDIDERVFNILCGKAKVRILQNTEQSPFRRDLSRLRWPTGSATSTSSQLLTSKYSTLEEITRSPSSGSANSLWFVGPPLSQFLHYRTGYAPSMTRPRKLTK